MKTIPDYEPDAREKIEKGDKAMTIYDILKDTNYKAEQFSAEAIDRLNARIEERTDKKGKIYAAVKCLVRKKEIILKPEEVVRQLFIDRLINEYGYPVTRMQVEYPVYFGREVKRADIVIMDEDRPTVPYIVIEVKKPKLKDGKDQLKSYCNSTGAPIAVWTNGDQIAFYNRQDPNYFKDIRNIPTATQTLEDIISVRWTIQDLKENDRLQKERISLKDVILDLEDEVLANAGVDVFEECFKLIFAKLYDEFLSGQTPTRYLEFTNAGRTDYKLKEKIQELFDKANQKWKGVFDENTKILLSPSHLAICVSSLQSVKLFNSNLDVVDDAFEYLMSKSSKGEKGQFFTPRYVIEMCVRMLNPKEGETMIDTACGSSGFPVHTIFHVWRQMATDRGLNISEFFSLDQKPYEFTEYVKENIFGIDFDEKAVRVARTLNLIAGDGHTNVLHLNTLDYTQWTETAKQEDWLSTYFEGFDRLKKMRKDSKSFRDFKFDLLMANPPFAGDIKESRILSMYELAKNAQGKQQSKVGRDILFIERNLDFLKPGGRMAIVLPQGRFNNSGDKSIREYIAERCRILAVVGIHGNVFKPHTGTKTSVLFVQKWDDELCPQKDDYPIFFATMQEPSKDNSGDLIYVKDPETGEKKLDTHGHMYVKHDLYNHEGLTQDGIAEAFIEFAKKEGLSFFSLSPSIEPFDEAKYEALMDGLECSEILKSNLEFSGRIDAEYYQKQYLKYQNAVQTRNGKPMGDLCHFLIGPFGSAYDTSNYVDKSDYRYIRGQDVKPFFVQNSSPRFMAEDDYNRLKKYALKEYDILISVVGTLGNSCIVRSDELPAIFSCKSTAVRTDTIDPFYLLTYLNTRYGRRLLLRKERGAIQKGLNLDDLKTLDIPCFSIAFQKNIRKLAETVPQTASESVLIYKEAQRVFDTALDYDQSRCEQNTPTERMLSKSLLLTGRLDAEYYQPKYDHYLDLIHSFDTTVIPLEYEVFKNSGTNYSESSTDVGVVKTKQLTNSGVDLDGIESYFTEAMCIENNSTFLENGDVVFASMGVGSLGKASIFLSSGEKKYVTDSTLRIFRAKQAPKVLPEVLCVYLQSRIGQELIYRYVVGSTGIISIYDSDISTIPIPILDTNTQKNIASKVNESFALRRKSKKLLEFARHAVEMAIEQGEDAALAWLKENAELEA